MAKGMLIQNENLKNTPLNIRGKTFDVDGEGVLACSETVAKLLLQTPGWINFNPGTQLNLDDARSAVLDAEADVQAAEHRLVVAETNLKRMESMVKDYKGHKAAEVAPDIPPVTPPPASEPEPEPEPETAESAAEDEGDDEEIDPKDFPTMKSSKDEILAFCEKHDISVDPSGTKSDMLSVIESETE